tara:strand:+ start:266 stop:502 length:237 start_codon:yes stop_codon:yes gene_type:complete
VVVVEATIMQALEMVVPVVVDQVGQDTLQEQVPQDKGMQVEMDIGHLVEITEFLEEAAVLEHKDPHLHTALSRWVMAV